MYAEEDITYTLDEIFPRAEAKCTLEYRVRVEPLSDQHFCILEVNAITAGRSLSWPDIKADQAVVFEKVKRLKV